jgi:hypothetical protein
MGIKAGRPTKVQDKIPSESFLGKMLKYWYGSPCTNGKKKQKNGQILFYLDPRTDLKAFVFLAKIWV